MLKKVLCIVVIGIFTLSLAGCVTFKKRDSEKEALNNQIHALEVQLQDRDQEILNLREALLKESEEKTELSKKVSAKAIPEVRSRPNVKQIQTALRNAGYEPGAIDGKMGRKTREAIRAFQRANGLAADGKVGKLTWKLLGQYLYTKAK